MLEFDEALDEGCRLMLTATLSQARALSLSRMLCSDVVSRSCRKKKGAPKGPWLSRSEKRLRLERRGQREVGCSRRRVVVDLDLVGARGALSVIAQRLRFGGADALGNFGA